jgi:hypothetical protein
MQAEKALVSIQDRAFAILLFFLLNFPELQQTFNSQKSLPLPPSK